jgi:uncharacterized membrane protein YhaH (DUF805 family)
MGFSDAIRSGFRNWSDFSGRASRGEFWLWMLFYFLSIIGATILAGLTSGLFDSSLLAALLLLGWVLAILVPTWAVAVRRLHDTGRSGWWMLLNFIPYLGIFVLIVLWSMPTAGTGSGTAAVSPLVAAQTLRELADLRDRGLITAEEYQDKRGRQVSQL